MRKKLLTIAILAATLLSLVACGNKKPDDNKAPEEVTSVPTLNVTPTPTVEVIDYSSMGDIFVNEKGDLFFSEAELAKRVSKVTLTDDNWKDYFSDFNYIEHKINKNDRDEVISEVDVRYAGFGLKEELKVILKDVKIRFDGETVFDEFAVYNEKTGETKAGTVVFKAGKTECVVYDESGKAVQKYDMGMAADEYVASITVDKDYCNGRLYSDHKFLGASGEMIIVNLDLPQDIKDKFTSKVIYYIKDNEAIYLSDDRFDEVAGMIK